MKMKKLYLLAVSALVFTAAGFSQAAGSENALFNEITTAYNTGFYPGVIELSSRFERDFPESAFINDVRLQKGRVLVASGQNDAAVETLLQLLKNIPQTSPDISECYYLLGNAYYGKRLFNNAVSSLYVAVKTSKGKNEGVYNRAVLYAGLSYYEAGDYSNALKEFEYVVSDGNKYTVDEYNDVLQKLIISYNNSNQNKKSVQLFNELQETDFADKAVYFTAAVYTAQAYENLNENQKAYDLYCKVIDARIKNLSVIALKKAYLLAEQKKVAVNPGEVLLRNEDSFTNQPELVCDFWIRLGIDEFNKKNFSVSSDYLENALKMIEEENVSGDRELITLYKAKIALETSEKSALKNELASFKAAEKNFEASQTENILDSYYSTLIAFNVNAGNWNELPEIYKKLKNPDAKTSYYVAAFYYNKKDFASAQKILEKFAADYECKKLLASCYLKNNSAAKACQLYEELENLATESGMLDSASLCEYAKALFVQKRYSKACEKAAATKTAEGNYIAGLCSVNLQKWNNARDYFNSYIKSGTASGFNYLALFYKGYAEYNLGEYKNAFSTFVRFTTDAKVKVNDSYIRQACDFSIKCALQNGDFKNASAQAELFMRLSKTKEEKSEAVLLAAQIYSDSGNYDKAIDSLADFTSDRSDFGLQALYQTALVYEKKGELDNAEISLEKIISRAGKSKYSETALFHQGEMYYSAKDYVTAENRFNKYVYKYADGEYADAALFYCADCDLRLGSYEKAIMLSEVFLSKFDRNTYSYGVYKNLMNAYYEEENFEQALITARTLLQKYPEQAGDDGIGKKANELTKLVSGSNKAVALKLNQYERLGGADTADGRKCGTELVQLYWKDSETQKEAFNLAQKLCVIQAGKNNEAESYAENLNVCAEYYRMNGNAKKAAENYLSSAMAYRSAGKDLQAAQSLYSAADAFVAAKLNGDARETAKTLKELYPESEYALAIDRITGN